MDLMILNTNLDAISVVDAYESFIWTNRYYEYGDFELYAPMRPDILEYIKQDYYVQRRDSDRLMIIEKVLINSDIENGDKITITGRSLESILLRRIVWGQVTLSGNYQDEIESLLKDCIINPSNPNRKISNFIFKKSNDPRITALTIEAQYTGDNLYEVIQKTCEERGVGFRVTLNDEKQFVFELYIGTDRSYEQSEVPYVVFSPDFDNVISSNYVESKSSLKNVALIAGEGEGSARRYTAVGNVIGLDRRELFVDARDISSDIDEDITALFDFTTIPSQAFNNSTKKFVSDTLFNSCVVDVSAAAGRTISITIPQYTTSAGSAPSYATILVNASGQYISTLQAWEKYSDTANRGTLKTYEIALPIDAAYIYTSMFSQAAITGDVYYGELTDFECVMVRLSSKEYTALLRQRGTENLAENTDVTTFEGQMETSIMYRYGVDFFDGDIVQIMNEYGHNSRVRVLEVVTSENAEGNSVYPTFKTVEEELIDPDEPQNPSLLPEGYTELSYIQSSGAQYIDTGFKPNQDTRVLLDVNLLSETAFPKAVFGARDGDSTSDKSFIVWSFTATQFRTDYGSGNAVIDLSTSGRYTIDKNRATTTINDTVSTTNTAATFQTSYNLTLFSQNDVSGVDSRMAVMRLYSCKIYDNDILIRDFIPAKNSTGIVGLYDMVDQTFYTNQGTGAFIAG